MGKCPTCGKEDGFCGRMECARWEYFKRHKDDPPPQDDNDDMYYALICATMAANGL